MDSDVENVDENEQPGETESFADVEALQIDEDVEASDNKRKKWTKFGVAFPGDEKCPYCKNSKPVTKKNWARHLQKVHPETLKALQAAESSQSTQQSQQQKLNFPSASGPSKPNRMLALYAGTTTMPLSHVENRYFQSILKMVPNMKIPDRRTLGKHFDAELNTLQVVIRNYLADSKYRYSFALDISTTKGMTVSLLGITAHVYAATGACIRVFGLDMPELTERHTGEYILKVFTDTLSKLKLSDRRTLRVVTDCGSNMLKAFYQPFRLQDESPDPDAGEIVFVEPDEDEMAAIEADELDEEQSDDVAQSFSQARHWHIKCVVHRLETCLRNAFKGSICMKELRKRLLKVVGKFARSHVLSKQLYDHTLEQLGSGLRLLFPATTRWSSVNIMYSRIKQVRQSLAVVCYANSIDEITSDDYRLIEAVLEITSPFRGFTKKLQQEGVPTISLVYAGVKGLIVRMSDAAKRNVLPEIARDLEQRLKAQFADVINSGTGDYDPIFMAAACLDPPAAQACNVFDENQQLAMSAIKEMARRALLGHVYD
ncbi:zinc finger BED domain-containing protein 4-like [Aphelenchoides avenae]|nr:zinc finger BED domain-containing protein 4-like [Aphelenchus avenae]